jgi:hypothetical protein
LRDGSALTYESIAEMIRDALDSFGWEGMKKKTGLSSSTLPNLCDAKYLSQRTIRLATIQAIAGAIDPGRVEEWRRVLGKRQGAVGTIRIGFPHCIWGAPLFLLANASERGYSVTSRADEDRDGQEGFLTANELVECTEFDAIAVHPVAIGPYRDRFVRILTHLRCLTLLRSLLDQICKIARGRPLVKDVQCNGSAAEAIDDRGDFEPLPQHSKVGHVEMPDLVRLGRVLHVPRCRRDARTSVCIASALRRLFLQNLSHRHPADLDPSSDDVPCDRARPELGLRECKSDLMHQPADSVVDPVPGQTPEHLLGPELLRDDLLPIPDRVGMNNEPLRSLLRRPATQPHHFEDLSPLRWCIVRPLVSPPSTTVRAEHFEFPLEQRGVVAGRVALAHHPHDRGRVIQHAGSRQHRCTHDDSRDARRQRPIRPLRLRHVDSPRTVVRSSQPDILKHFARNHLRPNYLFQIGHIGHHKRDPQTRWPTTHRVERREPRPIT